MALYVVLLFDLEDAVVVSADTVDARSRDDARAHAGRLLKDNPAASGYELWLDGIKIASWFPALGKNGAH
jgi:hypothetical protein